MWLMFVDRDSLLDIFLSSGIRAIYNLMFYEPITFEVRPFSSMQKIKIGCEAQSCEVDGAYSKESGQGVPKMLQR